MIPGRGGATADAGRAALAPGAAPPTRRTGRRVLAVIALLLLTGLLPSCAAIEPSSAGRPLGLAGDPAAEAREVAVRARDARVIYLGEVHDNAAHHAQQRRIPGCPGSRRR